MDYSGSLLGGRDFLYFFLPWKARTISAIPSLDILAQKGPEVYD